MNEAHNLATPYQQKLTWASLLASTYSLYQKQFWSFWRLAMPIALLAFLFTQRQRTLIHSLFDRLIAGHSNPRRILDSPLYLLIIAIWGYIDGAVYWLFSTTLFAAIACKLGQRGLSMDEVPISDAYTGVSRRAKVLFIFAILTWTPFWLARGLAGFCGWKLAEVLRIRLDSLAGLAVFSLPLLVVAALFCRMALAVPELMNEERVSVREALRRSFRTTDNWGLFFLFFLAKSAVVGYGVYWLAQLGLNELWTRTHIGSSAYTWIASAVYTAIAASLESPLFIAFCVLYRESQAKPEAAVTARATG